MHSHRRHNGGYRCDNASRGPCWNRLYCDRDRTHLAIVKAVVDAVLALEGMQDAILARARELHESGGKHEAELRRLEVRERKLRSQIEHLGHTVEHSGGEIASLVKRLAAVPGETTPVASSGPGGGCRTPADVQRHR